MKLFQSFADHPLGSWIINGIAVVAFILLLKLAVSQFLKDQGVQGAVKAAVQAI